MKRGDQIPVTIEGQTVAQAIIEQVEADRVTLVVPATRVVMGVVTHLAPTPNTSNREVIIDEVVRQTPTVEENPTVESSTPATVSGPEPGAATNTETSTEAGTVETAAATEPAVETNEN